MGSNSDEFQCACAADGESYNGSACLFANWLPTTVPALGGRAVETEDDMAAVMAHALVLESLPPSAWAAALALYPATRTTTTGAKEVRRAVAAVDRVSAMLVDSVWIGHCGTARAAAALASHNHSNIWLYHFAVPAGTSGKTPHFSEVQYVFGHCAAAGYPTCARPEAGAQAVSDWMMAAWASVARDGAPTAGAAGRDHAAATEWPRYDPDNGAENLRIDFEMSLEGEYRAEYCSFWEDLQLQLRKENLHGRIYQKQQKE